MINLILEEKEKVIGILKANISNCEVRVFGSRVNGNVKKHSDLDIVIIGERQIDKKKIYKLMEEFEYSDLNFRVDIIDYNSVSDSFKEVINRKNELLIDL